MAEVRIVEVHVFMDVRKTKGTTATTDGGRWGRRIGAAEYLTEGEEEMRKKATARILISTYK